MATILCVDDEPSVGVLVEGMLNRMGHRVALATSVEEGLRCLAQKPFDVVVADWEMPKLAAMDLLRSLQEEGSQLPVVVMSGQPCVEDAVRAIRAGAVDYIAKPVVFKRLEAAVRHALEMRNIRNHGERGEAALRAARLERVIVGKSAALKHVLELIKAAAPTRASVLLEGESGTGKEVLARTLHEWSGRANGPFVAVNCAAMPEGLIESALFGHEKGAFTGAAARVPGAFERADGGTLLLDEVSEMRLDLQAKLLRAIQEQEFERVGGTQPVRVDVRIVATTNRNLRAEVQAGRFRADLYYRLNVLPVKVPPLRERREDIPLLVQHFVELHARGHNVRPPEVSAEAMTLLVEHQWPGNVRELAHAVERALILAGGGRVLQPMHFPDLTPADSNRPSSHLSHITPASLPAVVLPGTESATEADGRDRGSHPMDIYDLNELERIAIARALEATNGNRCRAAKLLGISERTLRNKLKAAPLPQH
ncbi:MAG TPA: sigma-54 dependent transcriptional regulator [Gemmatimonadaceae bacterium]|nr:sigma-54 dependent transcriptional regulator [Gemmatimonadaceae bacterium]